MLLIDKYLTKEISKSSTLSLISLTLIFSLFNFLDEINKPYLLEKKIEYILYSIPSFAHMISILGVLIGAIVVLGKLSEIVKY